MSSSSPSSSSAPPPPDPVPVPDTAATATAAPSETVVSVGQRRKDMFGDCALVEIIHLHDCLRGALKALERDVTELGQTIFLQGHQQPQDLSELERRVAGRFKVIWSVFRAHSSAEDEFIWPTLQSKTQGRITGSPSYRPDSAAHPDTQQQQQHQAPVSSNTNTNNNATATTSSTAPPRKVEDEGTHTIEQEEYEEDHADEERMFSLMDHLLTKLRDKLVQQKQQQQQQQQQIATDSSSSTVSNNNNNNATTTDISPSTTTTTTNTTTTNTATENYPNSIHIVMKEIHEQTQTLSQHLIAHLAKEEKQCLPLVVKHLSKSEIHDLVGKIMGKRSSDMIAQIMTMAVQNLDQDEQGEMVKYMKQAMAGTFFDRWLSMSGWMNNDDKKQKELLNSSSLAAAAAADNKNNNNNNITDNNHNHAAAVAKRSATSPSSHDDATKRIKTEDDPIPPGVIVESVLTAAAAASSSTSSSIPTQTLPFSSTTTTTATSNPASTGVTSQAELEKLIRAIATNPNLSAQQKTTTIQGLRDSVWKSNQRLKQQQQQQQLQQQKPSSSNAIADAAPSTANGGGGGSATAQTTGVAFGTSDVASATVASTATSTRRVTPPSKYYKKNAAGKLERVWGSDVPGERCADDGSVPFFSASELAPTYHDVYGVMGAVLGCPHYARACKLRHAVSGRLYTCRLCCEQDREMPSTDEEEPLDRYAVTEVMCMKCNTLQPAEDRCVNPTCESNGQPFAKYFCRICHLYDDRPQPKYHCPYCNVCRMGMGLGIDFRHCMRCNACVSLSDEEHRCIPQKLQGSCPICHESLFQSTEPLRGLKCGHVMHLSCFTEYRRGQRYTCPLCMRCMEDMSDYFALLDAAVRMQPMPYAYLSTLSNVYCQDCEKTGQCKYHFVGQKCPHCGSYNTREMGRQQATATTPATGT